MVHGGVREVDQGIRKVKSRSGVCYFYCKISVTSKYVINLIIQLFVHTLQIKSSCRSAIHNSAKETGHT
jgi:hypothetical protein